MEAAEFDQKDAKLITLNHHGICYSFGCTCGCEINSFFRQWNELLSFLPAVSSSNAATYQSQSTQVKCLMPKMRENGVQLDMVSVIHARVLCWVKGTRLFKRLFS